MHAVFLPTLVYRRERKRKKELRREEGRRSKKRVREKKDEGEKIVVYVQVVQFLDKLYPGIISTLDKCLFSYL